MGDSLSDASAQRLGQTFAVGRQLLLVLRLVRYRFFLFAGLLPYLLGAAWALRIQGRVEPGMFWSGLGGVVLSVVGVEAFNEYFDAKMGTDRVFNPEDLPAVSESVLWLGIAAFAGALAVGVHLTMHAGWPILGFAALGGAAAIFYEAPPIRWIYRGLGETAIAIAYGPAMVLGCLYLQTQRVSVGAFWASLIPGLLIMALAVVNAIPDFHQDRLVGKRNLVVRLGRRRGVWLYLGLAGAALAVDAAGVASGDFPPLCSAALLSLPLLLLSARRAFANYESALRFRPAIGSMLACYVAGVSLFIAGLLPW
ncbi:MAG TPA: prenyltransferase [Steroidobacteraceae bacterium]|nr:prenyltransferase [Steroidobacteraceae bacterium]